MAKAKKGLKSYAVDTDRYEDVRIRKLRKMLGCEGLAVYDYLLCEIYRGSGCYLSLDDEVVFEVADYFDISSDAVMSTAEFCASVGLFDAGILEDHRVLTSSSIQRRYLELAKRARRKVIAIPEQYRLVAEVIPARRDEVAKVKPLAVSAFKIDKEVEELKGENLWLDNLQLVHHMSKEALRDKLDEFRVACMADGKTGHLDLADAKKHFNAWMRIINNNNRKDGNNNTGNQTKQTRHPGVSGTEDRRRGTLLRIEEKKNYSDSF